MHANKQLVNSQYVHLNIKSDQTSRHEALEMLPCACTQHRDRHTPLLSGGYLKSQTWLLMSLFAQALSDKWVLRPEEERQQSQLSCSQECEVNKFSCGRDLEQSLSFSAPSRTNAGCEISWNKLMLWRETRVAEQNAVSVKRCLAELILGTFPPRQSLYKPGISP